MLTRIPLLVLLVAGVGAADLPEWKRAYLPNGDAWKQVSQVFTFNNAAEPETLDPAIMTGVLEGRLALALFEGLVVLDPKTLVPRPGVAERWEVSDDQLTYTFHLRGDAKWSNGAAVTARDFARSWQRVLAPATGSQYWYQLKPVVGAEEYHSGKVADFSVVGIAVVDERTLRVRLVNPCSYFLDLVAFQTLCPVPMDVVEAKGDRWVRPENIVCNGPYRLADWEPRQSITMVKNEHYYDRGFCKLEKIVALPYDDLESAYKRYQQGTIDWMPDIPAAKIDEIKRLPDYYATPYFGTSFIRFNVTKPPFDDARLRRALAYAIDRREVTEHVLKAGEKPTGGFCPPIAGYEPIDGIAYDRTEARKLFAEAGYGEGGKPFPAVEILYSTNETNKAVCEAIVAQWKDVLGITIALRNCEWKVYLSEIDKLNYTVARSSWIGDYNDPMTFFDMFVTDGGNNQTGWSNQRYDGLVGQAQAEGDPVKRMGLFGEMERLLVVDECPIAPVFRFVKKYLLRDRVGGWTENIRDYHPYQYLWIEE
jgi:oligopeptide transport system substrate-binding protein